MIAPQDENPTTDAAAEPTAAPAAGSIGPVIDLRDDGPTTRVRVARDDNPFSALAPPERMRLIIRVLCELVAYDELEGTEERNRTIRAAMDITERPAARPTTLPGAPAARAQEPAAPTDVPSSPTSINF